MANFQKTRALWADDTDLLYTEMADIDEKTSLAISGEGGTYSLEESLIIGNADPEAILILDLPVAIDANVTISQDLFVSGDLTALGDVSLGNSFHGVSLRGDLHAYEEATFEKGATFNGEVVFNDDVTLDNDIFLTGGAYVYGQMGFYSLAYFGGGSDPIFDAPTEFNDPVEINAPVTLGSGGYIKKNVFLMPNSNVTAGPSTGVDEVHVDAGVVTGTKLFTISDCENGGAIDFSTDEDTALVSVRDPGGAHMFYLRTVGGGGTVYRSAKVRRIGGTWRVTDGDEL